MATYYSNTNTGYRLRLDVTQTSQNVGANTSSISYALYLESTTANFGAWGHTRSLSIDGAQVYNVNNQISIARNSTLTLATGTRTIAHNSDGTKSISLVASFDANTRAAWVVSSALTINESMTLTTIPRASQPTLNYSTRALGSAITISTNRASTSFTHTLTYAFGNQSGTIATGVTTSQAWTLPVGLASAIPNATSGRGTITCTTYNGQTLIGSKSVSFTATVPNTSTFQPTATISSIVEGASLPSGITAFVRHKSKAKVTSTGTGKYSATIKTYSVAVAGIGTYTGSVITSATLKNSGDVRVTLTVTDSRGLKGSTYEDIFVYYYSPPTISTFNASRSESTPANIAVNFNASISSITSQNNKYFRIRSKASDGAWVVKTDSTQNYTFSGTETIVSDPDKSYTIELFVQDSFTSITRTVQVGTAFTLIDYNSSGKGMAIGKVSESNCFEVAIPTLFQNNVTYQDSSLIKGGVRTPGYGYGELSAPGWYRVAKFDATGNGRVFVSGGIIEMELTRVFSNTNNEAHTVTLIGSFEKVNFFNQKTFTNQLIRGIRWQYDETNCYLDIYYSGTVANGMYFSITSVNAPGVSFTSYEPFTNVTSEATLYGSTDNLLGSETGSNDNGNYIRFSDGTMICTRDITFDHTINTVQIFPFPSSFIEGVHFTSKQLDGSKTTVTVAATSRYNNIIVYQSSLSNWSLRTLSPDTAIPSFHLKLFAIGRWK